MSGQILPVKYDTGTQKIFVGDGNDNLPNSSVVTVDTSNTNAGFEKSTGGMLFSDNGFAEGLNVFVREMTSPVLFSGGSIEVREGTWFIGVDLYSKRLICLPRLGHNGWVPAVKVTATSTSVVHIEDIPLTNPVCRIPNTLQKIVGRQSIEVTVMGSSLMLAYDASYWPRMLFSQTYNTRQYRLPTTITTRYQALGGNASVSQLSQCGFSAQDNGKYSAAVLDIPRGTVGYSASLVKSDLVVIGLLANSWEYNREIIEPVVRNLRKMGTEVLLVTDNQGSVTSGMTLSQYKDASTIYNDASWIFEVADKYGCAVADTAAYVLDAYYRIGYDTVYVDEIHQKRNGTTLGGPTEQPVSGAEVWAKAVRSLFQFEIDWEWSTFGSYTFSTTKSPWVNTASPVSVSISNGYLVVVSDSANDGVALGNIGNIAGDNIRVTFDIVIDTPGAQVSAFLYNSTWSGISGAGSQNISASGSYDLVFNTTDDNCTLVFWSSGSTFGTWKITNVVVHKESATITKSENIKYAQQTLANSGNKTNYKLPGMAQVILAPDEYNVANSTGVAGVLTSLPSTSYSFVRAHKGLTTSLPDTLTLTAGKEAMVGGYGCVGLGVIRPQASPAAVVSVYSGPTLIKSVSLNATSTGEAWYSDILSPSTFAQTTASPDYKSYRIVVTSGTLVVQALVVLSSEIEFLRPSDLGAATASASLSTATSGAVGFKTSTAGDTFTVKDYGRVQWLVSTDGGANSVALSSNTGTSTLTGSDSSTVYEAGGLSGSQHRCTLVSGDMTVCGAVVIVDR